jgi:hypothetical protein
MNTHQDRRWSRTAPALALIVTLGGEIGPADAGASSCSNPVFDPATLMTSCPPPMTTKLGFRPERPLRELRVGQQYAVRVIDPAKFRATGFEVPANTRMIVVRESDDTLTILHEETGESRRIKVDRQGQVLAVEKLS